MNWEKLLSGVLVFAMLVVMFSSYNVGSARLSMSSVPYNLGNKTWGDGYNEKILYGAVINNMLVLVGSGHNRSDGLVLAYDLNFTLKWYKYVDFGGNPEVLQGICADDDGNFVAVGWSNNGNDNDLTIVKMDMKGDILWLKTFDSGSNDVGLKVIYDDNDSTYVITGNSGEDTYLWKYSKDGTLVWDKDIASSDYNWDRGSTILKDGDHYIIGGYGDHPFQKDVFIIITDKDGNVQDVIPFGNASYDDRVNSLIATSNYFYAAVSEDGGNHGMSVYKFTRDGTELWNRSFMMGDAMSFWMIEESNNLLIGGSFVNQSVSHVILGELDSSGKSIWWYNDSSMNGDTILNILPEYTYSFYLVGYHQNTEDNTTDTLYVKYAWDVTPPTLNINSPSDNSFFNKTSVLVEWSGSDNYGIDHYAISDGGSAWTNVGLSNTYLFNNLSEGSHVLYVKAVDTSGNYNIEGVNVTVDVTKPTLTITYPVSGGYYNSTDILVEWSGSDNIGITHYEISLDGGSWTDAGLVDNYILNGLSPGPHTIFVKAVDASGNYNIGRVNITIDTTKPILKITSPVSDIYYNSTKLLVEWNTSDENGIKNSMLKVDNGSWIDVGKGNSYLLTISDGKHTLQIKSEDLAGNTIIKSINFTVDSTPPMVDMFKATQKGNSVKVDWDAVDNVTGVAYYMVKVDSGKWERIDNREMILNNLAPGKHTIHLRAYDLAGNYVEKSYTINVESEFIIPWLWIIVGIIGAVIAAGVVLFLMKRKKENEEEEIEGDESET